ncbi:MAG: T9SS type A sorting domain-containing protein [Bacteroidetes bacterium]|nr:T9SS type A sorting domain-containing protein [Bacteroidota bacterium]
MYFFRIFITQLFFLSAFDAFSQNNSEQIINNEKKQLESKIQYKKSLLTESYEVVYNKLEFDLQLHNHYLYGKITTCFKPLMPAFNIIQFDAEDYLKVDSVIYKNKKMNFYHSNKQLTVQLTNSIAIGKLDTVIVFYQANPGLNNPYKSFVFDAHNINNTQPIAWTLSQPYGAKGWWICKESLSDKIDSLDVFIKVKKGFTAVSNGILISKESVNDSQIVFHWKHRYPIATYLIALAATNYILYKDYVIYPNGDSLVIENYVYPESEADARAKTLQTVKIIKLFDSLFGKYPFSKEKYGHAQFGVSGGMEHQTISFMGSFNFDLIAHELAHQWFGDATTCGSWHDLWLNEGFATYSNMLCYENFNSKKDFISKMDDLNIQITGLPYGSVYAKDTVNTSKLFDGRMRYSKGAFLLHLLRWKTGDKAFFEGIRNYLNNPQCKFGFGTTEILKNELEKSSGFNLNEFFNDWFLGEGHPEYDIIWSYKSGILSIRIKQKPSHESVSFFNIPLQFLVSGINGDTVLVFEPISRDNTFTAKIDFLPTKLNFDPNKWVLCRYNVTQQINDNLPEVSIFPNPTLDLLNVYNYKSVILKIEVYDIEGKKILNSDFEQDNNKQSFQSLDVSFLKSGLYFSKIKTSNGLFTLKFIKK